MSLLDLSGNKHAFRYLRESNKPRTSTGVNIANALAKTGKFDTETSYQIATDFEAGEFIDGKDYFDDLAREFRDLMPQGGGHDLGQAMFDILDQLGQGKIEP